MTTSLLLFMSFLNNTSSLWDINFLKEQTMPTFAQHGVLSAYLTVRLLVGNCSTCCSAPSRSSGQDSLSNKGSFSNPPSPPHLLREHWLLAAHKCTTPGSHRFPGQCRVAKAQSPCRHPGQLWRASPAAGLTVGLVHTPTTSASELDPHCYQTS